MTEQKDIATVGVQVNQSAAIVSLIQRAATDESFDLEKLDRLLDVKERWEHEEARKAYVSALAAFKRNPPTLVKNQQVDFSARGGRTKYNYASLGDVASQVAAGLAEHGLSHGWAVKQEDSGVTVTCTLTHEWGHSESVSIAAPEDASGNKNSIQQIGSTITYLERYTLLAITGLAAHDQDDDGQAAGPRRSEPQQSRRPQQTRTQPRPPAPDMPVEPPPVPTQSHTEPQTPQETPEGPKTPTAAHEWPNVDEAQKALDWLEANPDTLVNSDFFHKSANRIGIGQDVEDMAFEGMGVHDWIQADFERTWRFALTHVCQYVVSRNR